ncbi:MAG: carbon-nitrogen hydrolase family protein [Myxococcales bacterium]|nr:carbon-nitrogen hydrolase family protein [Myxococcales bacterium]
MTNAPDPLVAAVVQMCARQDIDANLATASALCEQAVARGANLLVLPENYPYIGRLGDKAAMAERLETPGKVLTHAAELARRWGAYLLAGGVATRDDAIDAAHFYNTALLYDGQGELVAAYRKIHLFDVAIPDGAEFQESAHVTAGAEVVCAPVGAATLGLSICYDLRFPELYRQLARRGAEVVAVPAAFTLHTGKDHWLPLLRARAIENQVYVLAAGQHGRHTKQRVSYGKSCIIDPWGMVVAQASDGDGVAIAELDLERVARVRRELPCMQHARLLGD